MTPSVPYRLHHNSQIHGMGCGCGCNCQAEACCCLLAAWNTKHRPCHRAPSHSTCEGCNVISCRSLSMPALPAQGQEQKRKPSNSNSYNDRHGQITPYKEQAPSLPADARMNSTHRFGDGCQGIFSANVWIIWWCRCRSATPKAQQSQQQLQHQASMLGGVGLDDCQGLYRL